MRYHVGTPTNKGKKMAGKQRKTVFLDDETIEYLDDEIHNMGHSGHEVNYSDAINAMVKILGRKLKGVNKK